MNGFQIDAVNNALDELRAENKRLTLLHEISERQAQLENERLQRHATSMIDAMKADNERLQRRITTLEGVLGEMNVVVPE